MGCWAWSVALLMGFMTFGTSLTEARRSGGRVVFCYFGSWANYRSGDGKFVVEDIDPLLCSHAAYAFAKLEDNEIRPYDPYLDLRDNWGLGGYQRFNALKQKNSELKTLIAIGGWNEGSTKYSEMARNPQNRRRFVDSCVRFVRQHGFDGVDMDWEYPANRGGIPSDRENFVTLLREMKDAFRPHGFLLTAAVGAGQSIVDTAYDVPGINSHLDFINLMAYDFHGGWGSKTGLNAPLYSRSGESEQDKKLNADYAVRYWLKKGASPQKLVMGMGTYGRSFALRDPNQNGLGAPVTGQGQAGPYTREPGFMGYNEICEGVEPANRQWTLVFNDEHKGPYAYKERQWIGYDNKKSIAMKANYIKKMNLAGGMIWSIETDDFRGKCDGRRYPLLNTIRASFENRQFHNHNLTTTIEPPRPPNPERTTSPPPRPDEISTSTNRPQVNDDTLCIEEGYVRHPSDCKMFFYCSRHEDDDNGSDSGFVEYAYECAAGTVFSQRLGNCDFPHNVPECKDQI